MIDLWGVMANGLWILGLAVVLAALSWADWKAKASSTPLRVTLAKAPVQRILNLGLALFCAGLAATATSWWQRILWGALSLGWIIQIVRPASPKGTTQPMPATAQEPDAEDDPSPRRVHAGETGDAVSKVADASHRLQAEALRWLVGLAVVALSVWLLIQDLDWSAVWTALVTADYRWVVVGVTAIVATFFTRALRWRALLWHSSLSIRSAISAILVGQVVNLALPMRSGDVVRALWVAPGGKASAAEALGSIAVEKMWDLLALLACGLALLVVMPLPAWFARSTWATGLALAAIVGTVWCGLHWQELLFRWAGRALARFPAGWDQALLPRLRRLADGLEAIRRPEVSWKALLWTSLTWAFGGLANLAVLMAFDIPLPTAALFLLAALMVGGAVPAPGRLGVFEGVCVISLALFDIQRDRALAVGLVLHLVVVAPPLLGTALLALWPWWRRRRRASA